MIDDFSIEQCMKDIDHMLDAFDQIEHTQMRKKLKQKDREKLAMSILYVRLYLRDAPKEDVDRALDFIGKQVEKTLPKDWSLEKEFRHLSLYRNLREQD